MLLTDAGQAIWRTIAALLDTVGQKDWNQLRGHMRKAAILLRQLAAWIEQCAELTDEDLKKLIGERDLAGDSAPVLRQMEGLRTCLPAVGGDLKDAVARVFPKNPGGAPPAFENREEAREACRLILKYIEEGKSEFRAKKLARLDLAKRGKVVGKSTIDRYWSRHGEILNELSGQEILGQVFQFISTTPYPHGDREGSPN